MRWSLLLSFFVPFSLAEHADVIVVGGGLSGIAAAKEIASLRLDCSVVLLEARPTIGGRVRSNPMVTLNGTADIDIGAQWIAPFHSDLIQLVRSLGLTLEEEHECGERKVLLEGAEESSNGTSNGRAKRSITAETLPFDQIVEAADIQKLSHQTVQEWLEKGQLDELDKQVVQRYVQTVLDAPLSSVSPLQLLLSPATDGRSLRELLAGMGHGNGLRVAEGLSTLLTRFSEGVNIKTSQRVLSVTQEDNGTVVVTTQDSEWTARKVIIAVPPSLVSSIHFSPPLDSSTSQFLQSYRPTGNAFYFTITYNSPWWRANNVSGDTVYGNGDSDASPLRWMTTFDTSNASECGVCGDFSGVLWGMAHFSPSSTLEQRRDSIFDALSKTLGFTDAKDDVIDYKDMQFSHDEFSGGSIAVLPPTSDLSFLTILNSSISHGNVYFASSELSRASLGTMNGAILSGKAAAHEVNEDFESESETETEEAPQEKKKPSEQEMLYNSVFAFPPLSLLVPPKEEETSASSSPSQESSSESPSESSEPVSIAESSDDTVTESSSGSSVQEPEEVEPPHSSVAFQNQHASRFDQPMDDRSTTTVSSTVTEGSGETAESVDSVPTVEKEEEEDELKPFVLPGFEKTNAQGFTSSDFDYSTSTQYPRESTTQPPPAGEEEKGFDYKTSTHYPDVAVVGFTREGEARPLTEEQKDTVAEKEGSGEAEVAESQDESSKKSDAGEAEVEPTVDEQQDEQVHKVMTTGAEAAKPEEQHDATVEKVEHDAGEADVKPAVAEQEDEELSKVESVGAVQAERPLTSDQHDAKSENATVAEEEEEGPANLSILKNEEMVDHIPEDISSQIRTNSGEAFHYSTSTFYPPEATQEPVITPLVHFSNGNLPGQQEKLEKSQAEFSVDEPADEKRKDSPASEVNEHVVNAENAMQVLEREVPQVPKDNVESIGTRLLELLQKILALLKGN